MNKPYHPPPWADRLLEWFCTPHLLEEVQGDLHEFYGKWVQQYGVKKAQWLYVMHTLQFFRPFAFKRIIINNPTDMFKNYVDCFSQRAPAEKLRLHQRRRALHRAGM
jgi:hypothetical protein